ncbi:CPBP family intramembrane glutamic endopeptidase [Methanosarcina horonobensis]|uniref:CPBP family intramembrane glutamic endopeptidase n=1 Tax=Methanosarcina horonobensis TaxID=418008 RepID=UPI0019524ADF
METHIPFLTIPILFAGFFIGAAGEELGWTGYAIDPMQKRWNALTTSIILGLMWSTWHYPSMIQQGRDLTWIAWGIPLVCES